MAGRGVNVGLIALLFALGELFAENFLMPFASSCPEASAMQMTKLWGPTPLPDLIGGCLIMMLTVLRLLD